MHPTPIPPVPDSPDRLIALWAAAPPPKPERSRKPRRIPLKPRASRRPFGWLRLAKRTGVPPRLLWAAYRRDQARALLTQARVARAILPYCEHKAAESANRAAREPQDRTARILVRLSAEALETMTAVHADRRRDAMRLLRDRWLPDADAAARLREHGLA